MHRFQTTLVPGKKRPYTTWTFLNIPHALAKEWGAGQKAVRGTISGKAFRGTVSRGEGVLRMPVPRDLRGAAGVCAGDTVAVALELDTDPRPVDLPHELRAVFNDAPDVAARTKRYLHHSGVPGRRMWRKRSDRRLDCSEPAPRRQAFAPARSLGRMEARCLPLMTTDRPTTACSRQRQARSWGRCG